MRAQKTLAKTKISVRLRPFGRMHIIRLRPVGWIHFIRSRFTSLDKRSWCSPLALSNPAKRLPILPQNGAMAPKRYLFTILNPLLSTINIGNGILL